MNLKRSQILGVFFALFISSIFSNTLLISEEPGSANQPVKRQPNIVLIMADDVSWEAFGCYGAEDYKTPHLDQMAKQECGLRIAIRLRSVRLRASRS